MTELKLITDPGQAFRLFANAYRELKPTVPISEELASTIDQIVECISAYEPCLELLIAAPLHRNEGGLGHAGGGILMWS